LFGLWCLTPLSTIFQLYYCHDIAEILLKVVLNSITLTTNPLIICTLISSLSDLDFCWKLSRWFQRLVFNYIMLYWGYLAWAGFKLTTLVVIGTDCIGSCKSNYHTIMATTAPLQIISRYITSVKLKKIIG
jgi:hypothetical protein